MGSSGVVVVPELIKLLLQLFQGGGTRSSGQPLFESFPGPFNFSLGSGFIWSTVFLNDSLELKQSLKGVEGAVAFRAASMPGRVNVSVVGEGGRGVTVLECCAGEVGLI